MKSAKKIMACQDKTYDITTSDLPLCCPMPNMELWDAHPRVYLPIEETGREACPYCGATYILKGEAFQSKKITTAAE